MAILCKFVIVGLCDKCKAMDMCTGGSYQGLIEINNYLFNL